MALIVDLSELAFAQRLYPKSRRAPKKKVVKKFDPKVKHISTAKIPELRKTKKFMRQ